MKNDQPKVMKVQMSDGTYKDVVIGGNSTTQTQEVTTYTPNYVPQSTKSSFSSYTTMAIVIFLLVAILSFIMSVRISQQGNENIKNEKAKFDVEALEFANFNENKVIDAIVEEEYQTKLQKRNELKEELKNLRTQLLTLQEEQINS